MYNQVLVLKHLNSHCRLISVPEKGKKQIKTKAKALGNAVNLDT